jgi:hypothetical protein
MDIAEGEVTMGEPENVVYILQTLENLAADSGHFHLAELEDWREVMDLLQRYPQLLVNEEDGSLGNKYFPEVHDVLMTSLGESIDGNFARH